MATDLHDGELKNKEEEDEREREREKERERERDNPALRTLTLCDLPPPPSTSLSIQGELRARDAHTSARLPLITPPPSSSGLCVDISASTMDKAGSNRIHSDRPRSPLIASGQNKTAQDRAHSISTASSSARIPSFLHSLLISHCFFSLFNSHCLVCFQSIGCRLK